MKIHFKYFVLIAGLLLLGCENSAAPDSNEEVTPPVVNEQPVDNDDNDTEELEESETNSTASDEGNSSEPDGDNDLDGIINSLDPDDDNDGILDDDEISNGTNPLVREAKLISYPSSRYGSSLFLLNAESNTKKIEQLLVDINPTDSSSSTPKHFTAVNENLFFVADDGMHGRELWKTDGTSENTVMVKNMTFGKESSVIDIMGAFNDLLLYRCDDSVHGFELCQSDGTAEGTFLIADLYEGFEGSNPYSFITNLDNFYFLARSSR